MADALTFWVGVEYGLLAAATVVVLVAAILTRNWLLVLAVLLVWVLVLLLEHTQCFVPLPAAPRSTEPATASTASPAYAAASTHAPAAHDGYAYGYGFGYDHVYPVMEPSMGDADALARAPTTAIAEPPTRRYYHSPGDPVVPDVRTLPGYEVAYDASRFETPYSDAEERAHAAEQHASLACFGPTAHGARTYDTFEQRRREPDLDAQIKQYQRMQLEAQKEGDYLRARVATMRLFAATNRGRRDRYSVVVPAASASASASAAKLFSESDCAVQQAWSQPAPAPAASVYAPATAADAATATATAMPPLTGLRGVTMNGDFALRGANPALRRPGAQTAPQPEAPWRQPCQVDQCYAAAPAAQQRVQDEHCQGFTRMGRRDENNHAHAWALRQPCGLHNTVRSRADVARLLDRQHLQRNQCGPMPSSYLGQNLPMFVDARENSFQMTPPGDARAYGYRVGSNKEWPSAVGLSMLPLGRAPQSAPVQSPPGQFTRIVDPDQSTACANTLRSEYRAQLPPMQ